MKTQLLILSTLSLLMTSGCDSDSDNSTSDAAADSTVTPDATVGDSSTVPDASAMPDAAPDATSGGGAITATGSINGNAFTVNCDAAYYEQTGLGSLLQCQGGGLHIIQCRTDESDAHGVKGQVAVVVAMIPAGDTTVNLDNPFSTVKMGGTLGEQLTKNAANVATHEITVDSFQLDTSAKGSFTASWTDAGGDYGEVSGTFDYRCRT